MNGKFKIEGLHSTTRNKADNILSSGKFLPSKKDNEWLGKGVYFWTKYADALFWVNNSYKNENEMCIITAHLEDENSRILDLDIEENMTKLVEFVNTFNKEMVDVSKYRPKFNNESETRCFYCELFKKKYNINIILYSFPINGYNVAGFNLKRRQFCVSDIDTISIVKHDYIRKDECDVI